MPPDEFEANYLKCSCSDGRVSLWALQLVTVNRTVKMRFRLRAYRLKPLVIWIAKKKGGRENVHMFYQELAFLLSFGPLPWLSLYWTLVGQLTINLR